MGLTRLFLVIILGAAAASGVVVVEAGFKCSSAGKTCRSLVDYSSPNETTLGDIQKLFNLKHVLDIVGANALPSATRGNHTVKKGDVIKIPFQCKCSNGTGLSNNTPLYTIQKGDTLYHIAVDVFSKLVPYQQLQALNNIPDPTKIQPGQKVWIPLPCSCDQVDGTDTVHYGHLVPAGVSFQQIAQQYGTTQDTLLALNGISDPKPQPGPMIDVPLKACSSSTVKNVSLDYPLLVANGTDTYTANGCVKCSCNSAANNAPLQCEPSQVKPYRWDTCPSMLCGNSTIGNITSTASCTRTVCAYAGYKYNQTIYTALVNESTCLSPTGSPAGSGASRISLQGWGWNHLSIALHFIFFCVYLS